MNLGELKASLSRFPEDMDVCQVTFAVIDKDGDIHYDLLAFTSYVNDKHLDIPIVLLGSDSVAVKMMLEKKVVDENGRSPTEEGFQL